MKNSKVLAENDVKTDWARFAIIVSAGVIAAEIHIPIIFTTAYDNFALQAFKVYSVDYMMKPIDVKDLKRALEKYGYFKAEPDPGINLFT